MLWAESSIVLSPLWPGLPPLVRFTLLLALALVPLVLIVILAWHEMRLVRPAVAIFLLGLRLLALAAVLLLVGFRPAFSHETSIEKPGAVAVLVDRSASMSLADPQRTPDERARLATALKL